jgi:hypothetical protein
MQESIGNLKFVAVVCEDTDNGDKVEIMGDRTQTRG